MTELMEDTHQYIVVHQATLRNRVNSILTKIFDSNMIGHQSYSQLMWLSLMMESCLISTAIGAAITASFGMNLQSGVQENTHVSFLF